MPRRKRGWVDNACYHITHRCHNREFLFRYKKYRQFYLRHLFEMQKRYRIDVLDYIVTSNHVHLLLAAKNGNSISEGLRYLHGRVGQWYNRQVKSSGSFWSDLSGNAFLITPRVPELSKEISKILEKYHAVHKYSWGIDGAFLGNTLDLKTHSAAGVIKEVVKSSNEFQFTHGRLSLESFDPAITEKQIKQKDAIFDAIEKAGFDCAAKGKMITDLGVSEKVFRLLTNILVEEGEIVIMGKHYMSRSCFNSCEDKLRELATKKGVVEINDYRELTKTGRNITVVILEKFDSLGITKRFPDGRKLI